MIKFYHSFFFFIAFFSILNAQVEEVAPPEYIKTIVFKSDFPEDQFPVIELGDILLMQFDVLNGDEEDYYYKIKHYNFDWTPSVLVQNEFMAGLDNQRIRNYQNSFNTYQTYSHYTLQIPNQFTTNLKVSGNYMLEIYDDNDELVFSRKFMIYEPLATVGVQIKRSRDVKVIDQLQVVDFKVNSSTIQFVNPEQTVKTVVLQNNNFHSAITDLKPTYTLGNELIYKPNDNSSAFYAGNEYFNFENKDIRATGFGVLRTRLNDLYNNYLYTNVERFNNPYTYNPDINGNFLVNVLDANPSTEADYAWIHFSLQTSLKLEKGQSIHLFGNFNNYAINESTKMYFDDTNGIYRNEQLLKQGFYNYKFVVVNKNGTINEGAISGDYYQTENNYKVLVYYKQLAGRYDRLIGIGEASSVNISN